MIYKCPVCGNTPSHKKASGFALEVEDECIEWPEAGEIVPTDEKYWCRRNELPQVGELHTVKVTYPFNHELGEEFWVLFMPGLSYFNGWEEYPDEIAKSGIIKCRFEQILEEHIKHGWIQVTVLEVVPLAEVCKVLRAVNYDEDTDWNVEEYDDKLEYGCWKYYSWNCQGDVGGWSLIYTDEMGVHHIILRNQWLMCDSHTYCGNIILEKEALE